MKIAFLVTDNREPYRQYSSMTPWFGTAPEALLQGFREIPEVEIHVVTCTQKPMKSPDKLADNIWFHSLYVPKHGWMRTSYQGCIRAVRRKLKSLKPTLVHGQGTERECALSAVFSRLPNVLTIHGNMRLIAEVNQAKPLSFQWLAAQLEKIALPRTNGVVCITRYTRDAVKDLAQKTWIVPNAVDQSFFKVRPQSDGSKIILCIGAICHRKNQNAFIRALDPVAATRKFKVLFLGATTDGELCTAEFKELLATRPWCEHLGFVGREDLKAHLARASLVALPSLEDNCPMAVLEGMAAGVPVLAANVGGVPDLVQDGVNGLLRDISDPPSMGAGVAKILDDPALGTRLALAARRDAEARFQPLVIARRHVEIYREVLSASAGL